MQLTQSQTSHQDKLVSIQLRLLVTNTDPRVMTCVWPNRPADEMEIEY
ncbi:hypothetical protein [Shewanella sp. YLB-07]|nr:hypothetical protein [Shewanella sp. YLB-07]